MLYVDVALSNVRDRQEHGVEPLRVSTSSMLTWLPAGVLEAAGIRPERTRALERTDGSRFTRWTAPAILHVEGRSTVDDVIICEPGDEPILGWRALSGLNLQIDEATQRLVDRGPIPAAAA